MNSVRVRLRVRGRVQGVWFRGSAQERARELGLVGWVRNEPDGSVELEAEGSRDAVDALTAWCRTGPDLARVDAVDVASVPATGAERDFQIAR